MAETVELDEAGLDAAEEALYRQYETYPRFAVMQMNCHLANDLAKAAIRTYLRTAGLVSVPVLKEGEL
jgi:hypothetical protein